MKPNNDMLQFLRALGKDLRHQYEGLSHGGCCVLATVIAIHLRHIVPTRVAVVGYDSADLNYIREATGSSLTTAEWYYNGCDFWHVLVEFDYDGQTWLVDQEGIYTRESIPWQGMKVSDGALTIQEALAFAADEAAWNDQFDRRQIPALRKDITRHFREYGNRQRQAA